jgi:hypothetical protein
MQASENLPPFQRADHWRITSATKDNRLALAEVRQQAVSMINDLFNPSDYDTLAQFFTKRNQDLVSLI